MTMRLAAHQVLDSETGVHLAYHESMKWIPGNPHCHEFFELFMIARGQVVHHCNGTRTQLHEGDLVLIRPDDVHTYEQWHAQGCLLINIAFSVQTLRSLYDFLGSEPLYDNLLREKQPPQFRLETVQKFELWRAANLLTAIPIHRKADIRLQARALIAETMLRYFIPKAGIGSGTYADEFDRLEARMGRPENFSLGIPRLKELAPYSYEHVCRTIKKKYGKTPTEWINEFRIHYAANLLAHSDKPIVDVAGESGFEQLSHFYSVFKKQYGDSPAQYRKKSKRTIIP